MILRDARVLVDGLDLSGDHNEITLTIGATEQDGTHFGDRAERIVAGLETLEASGKGFARLGPDGTNTLLRGNLGVEQVPMTIMSGDPDGPDPLAIETFVAEVMTYRVGAQVGQLLAFEWTAKSNGSPSASGSDLQTSMITTNGTSAVKAIPLAKGEVLQVTLHVLGLSGTNPTLTVVIESDDTLGFGSPKTQITFPTMSAIGAVSRTYTGKQNEDGYWRARWTVGGTAPGFQVALVIGTQRAVIQTAAPAPDPCHDHHTGALS